MHKTIFFIGASTFVIQDRVDKWIKKEETDRLETFKIVSVSYMVNSKSGVEKVFIIYK